MGMIKRVISFWMWLFYGLCWLVLVGGMVTALRLMGRIWWCACGQLRLWGGRVDSAHNSQHLIDWYSLSHVLHGFLFYWALSGLNQLVGGFVKKRWLFFVACLVEAGWEVLENSPWVIERYRETMAQGYTGDSIVNSVGDLMACGLGFWIAWLLGWKKTLVVFVVVELFMLFMIKDNLTLNVVMLVYPFEGIRVWQMGG